MKEKIEICLNDAFVIIDGQNDFIQKTGKLYVAGINGESQNFDIVAGIKNIYSKFYNCFTTEDEHPSYHVEFGIFGPHCEKGSEGQEYIADLTFEYDASVNIKKGNDLNIISYSVATSPKFADHIAWLRQEKVKRIFLVGWAYTHCVGESAIAYACQDFEVYVIRDLTRSVPAPYGDANSMKQKLAFYGVKEIYLKDIE